MKRIVHSIMAIAARRAHALRAVVCVAWAKVAWAALLEEEKR